MSLLASPPIIRTRVQAERQLALAQEMCESLNYRVLFRDITQPIELVGTQVCPTSLAEQDAKLDAEFVDEMVRAFERPIEPGRADATLRCWVGVETNGTHKDESG